MEFEFPEDEAYWKYTQVGHCAGLKWQNKVWTELI